VKPVLDDPTKHVLAARVRDAERRLLRAKDDFDRAAAHAAYDQALREWERYKGDPWLRLFVNR
jgi:hypothetical protein